MNTRLRLIRMKNGFKRQADDFFKSWMKEHERFYREKTEKEKAQACLTALKSTIKFYESYLKGGENL